MEALGDSTRPHIERGNMHAASFGSFLFSCHSLSLYQMLVYIINELITQRSAIRCTPSKTPLVGNFSKSINFRRTEIWIVAKRASNSLALGLLKLCLEAKHKKAATVHQRRSTLLKINRNFRRTEIWILS